MLLRKGGKFMARTSFNLGKPSSSTMTSDDVNKLIAKKAYELYEKRGKKAGHSMDDWLEAERIIKGKLRK